MSSEESIERFRLLFNGLDRVHGQYDIDPDLSSKKDKVQGNAVTKKEPVTVALWELHVAGQQGLGIVPIRDDQCCVFCALDIDEYDLDLKKLNQEVQKLQLPFVVCRTKSGGAHLYIFFKEPVRAEIARDRLKLMADAVGYPAVEIFPKQRALKKEDVGNWINMPYFNTPGPTNRYALDEKGKALATLEEFVEFAESKAISKEAFIKLDIPVVDKPFQDGPPCLQRLTEANNGFPEGTRNNALFNVGVYVRQKFGDEWQDKLEEFNHKLMDPPLKSGEVQAVIKSLGKSKYFYTCDQSPIASVCARDACLGRQYGIGNNNSADGGEIENMLGSLQRAITVDMYGVELHDEKPEWYMDVDGIQITLSTPELMNQERLRTKLAEAMGKYPAKVRPQRWEAILKEKIEGSQTVELGPETGTFGHIVEALRDFCTNHGGADTRMEIETGQVWGDENGFLWFKHQPFWEFLVRRGIYRPRDSGKELNRIMCKNIGAEKRQLMLQQKPKQINRDCWCVKDWTEEEKDQIPEHEPPETEF